MELDAQRRTDLWKILSTWTAQDRFERTKFQATTLNQEVTLERPELTAFAIPRWEFDEYVTSGLLQLTMAQHVVAQDHRIDEFEPGDSLAETLKVEYVDTRTHLNLEEEQLLAILNQAWEVLHIPFLQPVRGGNHVFTITHPGLPNNELNIPHRVMGKLLRDEFVTFEVFNGSDWKAIFNITSKGRDWYETTGSKRFSNASAPPSRDRSKVSKPRFFIVYGHDIDFALQAKNYLQNVLSLPEPVLLAEKAFTGRTVIEKLEEETEDVDAALILVSPDDKMIDEPGNSDAVWRARQNVILELGYFMGKWPRKDGRVIVVWKKDKPLDLPSDFVGVGYVGVTTTLSAAGDDLRREIHGAFPNVMF